MNQSPTEGTSSASSGGNETSQWQEQASDDKLKPCKKDGTCKRGWWKDMKDDTNQNMKRKPINLAWKTGRLDQGAILQIGTM